MAIDALRIDLNGAAGRFAGLDQIALFGLQPGETAEQRGIVESGTELIVDADGDVDARLLEAYYDSSQVQGEVREKLSAWLSRWRKRVRAQGLEGDAWRVDLEQYH